MRTMWRSSASTGIYEIDMPAHISVRAHLVTGGDVLECSWMTRCRSLGRHKMIRLASHAHPLPHRSDRQQTAPDGGRRSRRSKMNPPIVAEFTKVPCKGAISNTHAGSEFQEAV
jgi:hypothetical protein